MDEISMSFTAKGFYRFFVQGTSTSSTKTGSEYNIKSSSTCRHYILFFDVRRSMTWVIYNPKSIVDIFASEEVEYPQTQSHTQTREGKKSSSASRRRGDEKSVVMMSWISAYTFTLSSGFSSSSSLKWYAMKKDCGSFLTYHRQWEEEERK